MLHHSSESTHIIWSMLFVAGALVLSYMFAFDRGHFLVGLGDIDEVVANEQLQPILVQQPKQQDQTREYVNQQNEPELQEDNISNEIVSLSDTLQNTAVVSLSDVLRAETIVGQGTQAVFESPDPVLVGDKQFFSVQQLFAQTESDESSSIQVSQGVLALENTYQWNNNGRFVLPEAIGVGEHVEYILKDQWNTHYVYLGDYRPLVFDTIVFPDTVVAIDDKISINRSGFFGDSLWIFSLAKYEARQKIIALVRFEAEKDTWLFQIDRDRFETGGKTMIQSSFATHYTQ